MHFVSIAYVGAAFRNLKETLIVLIILLTPYEKKILTISNVYKMFPAESSGKPLH